MNGGINISLERDLRYYGEKISSDRKAELNSLASEIILSGKHRVRIASFDAATGNPAVVVSESAPAEKGNYIKRALDHMIDIRGPLGLTGNQSPEYSADPYYQKTSSGAISVHLQQLHRGIPIFQSTETVRFAPNGSISETIGNTISVFEDIPVSPQLSVEKAVLKAAQYVTQPEQDEQETDQFGEPMIPTSVDLDGFEPKVIATFRDKSEQPTVLEEGPFGDKIKANLILFPMNKNLRLAWETVITMPLYESQYRTLVDAENGEILYCHQLVQDIMARGNVYLIDGGNQPQMMDFPRQLIDYDLPIPNDLPTVFPDTWVEKDRTIGNNVISHLNFNGPTMKGTSQDGIVYFDPEDKVSDKQKILNIFYFNNFMHDYFYLLGFREKDGNFQEDNFGRGGAPTDRVEARTYNEVIRGTATMGTRIDGLKPIMKMGVVRSTKLHTAFDSSVVFHEYTHGVTNRLVGGRMDVRSLESLQSGGMGEGWSDYFPCTINNTTVVGAWVTNQAQGIRDYPYDSDFPDNFGDLGSGRYNGEKPHPIGEIWCATLMEMNRNITTNLGVQLVVDALKLSPSNPSFLDMRDSILAALDAMLEAGMLSSAHHSETLQGIWAAFAKFGMGPNARSNGASLSGIIADFQSPIIEGGIEPISLNVPVSSNLPEKGSIKEYVIKGIESDKILDIKLEGPSGQDFDLYVKFGDKAKIYDWDYRGYAPTSNEEITIDPTKQGDYYFMVHSFKGSGNFSLEAKYLTDKIEQLILDIPTSSVLLEKSMKEYVLKEIASSKKLTINLEGPEGQDFDLYVKFGTRATINDWDYQKSTPSSNEEITIDSTQEGNYYILVRSFKGSGSFNIIAQYVPESVELLHLDELVSSVLSEEGSIKEYVLKAIEGGSKLTIQLEGTEGQDFDLYAKFGSRAKIYDWDHRSSTPSHNEQIIIDSTKQGNYYLAVHAFKGNGSFHLRASAIMVVGPKMINIIHPSEGEVWERGKTYTIQWESQNIGEHIKIMLESENNGMIMISENAPNEGRFQYRIPDTLVYGQYKVHVESMDGSVKDQSKLIFIVPEICTIPPYNPNKWNDDPTVKRHNNCYNYACDRILFNSKSQPGRATGSYPYPMACNDVTNAAVSDGLKKRPETNTLPVCYHKVALVVAPDYDYHWYRLDDNAFWSHKPGSTAARNVDNSGNLITDPRTADRGPYTEFCGFFWVCQHEINIK